MALQHLRTSTAHKRPIPSVMSAGQLAVNINEASPGLFFKDSNGDLVKVGPVHIGTDAPNSSPASVAATALVTGTVYQILTVGTSDFTLVGASANTVGTVFTATGTTTGDGTVSGQQGVEKGEQWLDTTGGTYVLKIYDGTAWRSESGTFVDVNGDTMTGSLILPSGTAAAPALGVGSTDNGLYSPGTDQVAVSTNGTGRLFIDASGNIGIGEAAPDGLLVIKGNSDAATTPSIRLKDGTDTREAWITNSAGDLSLNVGGDDNVAHGTFKIFDSGIFDFAQGAGSRLRIDSSGRLLVGQTTQSNSSLFTIKGNTSNSAGASEITLQRGEAATAITSGESLGHLYFTDSSSNKFAEIAGWADAAAGSSDYPGRLVFSTTADGASSPTERMRIDRLGRVGIGTTSPTSPLHIASEYFVPLTLQQTDVGTNYILFTKTSGGNQGFVGVATGNDDFYLSNSRNANLIFQTNTTERLRIDSSGRLLVNTSSSRTNLVNGTLNAQLQVEGVNHSASSASLIRNSADANNAFLTLGKTRGTANGSNTIVQNGDGLGNLAFLGADGTNLIRAAEIYAAVDGTPGANDMPGRLVFAVTSDGASSPTERMRIDSSGNVGIGTSSPGEKLDVAGVVRADNFTGRAATTAMTFGLVGTDTAVVMYGTGASPASTMVFRAGSSERMRIDSSGNVGIGNTDPEAILTLGAFGGSTELIRFRCGTAQVAGIDFGDDNDPDIGRIRYHHSEDSMLFTVNAGERMRISSAGNVGIGTSNPIVPLHVIGNQRFEGDMDIAPPSTSTEGGQITLRNPGGSTTGATIDVSAADVLRLFQLNNNSVMELGQLAGTGGFIKFVTEGSERMRINSSGNVGIGTSSPTYFGGNYKSLELAGNSGGVFRSTGGSHSADFYQDVSGTAILRTATAADLALKTNDTEHMRINSSGNVFVHTTTNYPGSGNTSTGIMFEKAGDGTTFFVSRSFNVSAYFNRNSNGTLISMRRSGSEVGTISVTTTATAYNTSSDYRLKENVVDLDGAIDRVKQLAPRRFNFITDPDTTVDGFLAHEAQTVVPEAVTGTHNEVDDDGNAVMQGIDQSKLVPLLTAALKEAIAKIETLEQRLTDAGL